MMLWPYLKLGDVEIANNLRLLTYIRRGLAGSRFEAFLCDNVSEGGGYADLYGDVYEPDPFNTRNLRCYCEAIDGGPYDDPAYDNAPWYDVTRPESADFLGLYVSDARIRSVLSRSLTTRSNGGGDIGPGRAAPRVIEVVGLMVAATPGGMAYGEKWLRRALIGSVVGCANDTLTILPACPDDGSTDALRDLANVGLVDPPVFTSIVRAESQLQEVAFQLVAGQPYLRSVSVVEADVDLAAAPTTCVELDARPVVLVEEAAVLRITAGAGTLDGVLIEGRYGSCPQVGAADITLEIVDLSPMYTLVIDSSTHTVQATDAAGTVVSGLQFLDFDGMFPWLTAVGDQLCLCISTAGATGLAGATLDIDVVEHEA